ncbi:hypothetical protein TYRP_022858 [Tyrophagus putrescentiae]|nr:hypothetical protein TYRP_022858 [Tyrophagus putrescentiae]
MYKHLKVMINGKMDHLEDAVLSDVASIIEKRFYVDDLIVSFHSSTSKQINKIKETTETIFVKTGMNVRKWRANLKELDQLWSPDASNIVKLLGHLWTVAVDTFSLTVEISPEVHHSILTIRLFASLMSQIYDLLGLNGMNQYLMNFVRKHSQQFKMFTSSINSHSLAMFYRPKSLMNQPLYSSTVMPAKTHLE